MVVVVDREISIRASTTSISHFTALGSRSGERPPADLVLYLVYGCSISVRRGANSVMYLFCLFPVNMREFVFCFGEGVSVLFS